MIPKDQPKASYHMISKFFKNEPLCEFPNCEQGKYFPQHSTHHLDGYHCPHNCSAHGVCNPSFKCICDPGYSQSDCSFGYFQHVHEPRTFNGRIEGKGVNTFQFELQGTTSTIDVDIILEQLSSTGLAYVLVNVSESTRAKSASDITTITMRTMDSIALQAYQSSFHYANVSHWKTKHLSIKDALLARSVKNVITVVVYNARDEPLEYKFSIQSIEASGKINTIGVSGEMENL